MEVFIERLLLELLLVALQIVIVQAYSWLRGRRHRPTTASTRLAIAG